MSDKGYHGYYDSRYAGESSYRGRGRGGNRGGSFRGSRGSHDYYSQSSNGSHRYTPYYSGRGGARGSYSSYPGGRDVYRSSERTSDRYEVAEEVTGAAGGEYDDYYGLYHGRGSGNYRGNRGRGAAVAGGYYKGSREHEENPRSVSVSTEKSASGPKPVTGDKAKGFSSKSFNNPWIPILRIQDEKTQAKLERNYSDLASVNKELLELQIQRFKLSTVVESLEKTTEREALHVQITNEKLEEFTYL